jgi:hypothetical protein
MKRVLGAVAAVLLPATFLVACGGDDSADSTTTSSTTSAERSGSGSSDSGSSSSGSGSSGSGSTTGHPKVDKYCQDAKALAEKWTTLMTGGKVDDMQELAEDARKLAEQSAELNSEAISDERLRDAMGELSKCAEELSKAMSR